MPHPHTVRALIAQAIVPTGAVGAGGARSGALGAIEPRAVGARATKAGARATGGRADAGPRRAPARDRLLTLLPLLGAAVVMSRATAGDTTRVDTSEPRVDADLIHRARHGEREAFGIIYDHYADVVYRFAFYRVGGNRTVAEDVVSETFLRALTRISTFEWQGRDIGAWLVTIARNHIVDLARSGRARLEFPAADLFTDTDGGVALRTSVPGAEDAVLSALDLRDLLQAVSSLGTEQRECVTLRFLEGLSVRETAQAMNKKEGAVRALQLRAVRALARRLPAARGD